MNMIEEIINRPEVQIFASAAIVRQATKMPGVFPETLVTYHTGILEELGIDTGKLRYMETEKLSAILPDVLNVRR